MDLTPWSAGGPGPEHHAYADHNRNDVLLGKGDSNSAGEIGNAQRAWRIMDWSLANQMERSMACGVAGTTRWWGDVRT